MQIDDWATSSTRVARAPLNARPGGPPSARKLPYLSDMPWSSYIQEWVGGKNNSMALNGDDSNEEPTAGAVAIQITLPMVTYLLTIAYRITVKLLSV